MLIKLFIHTVVHTSGSARVANDLEYWFCLENRVKYYLFSYMACLVFLNLLLHLAILRRVRGIMHAAFKCMFIKFL